MAPIVDDRPGRRNDSQAEPLTAESGERPMAIRPVALVTGSGKRRVGRTVADALAARGHRLALPYRHSAVEAQEAVAEFGARGVAAGAAPRGPPRGTPRRAPLGPPTAHLVPAHPP